MFFLGATLGTLFLTWTGAGYIVLILTAAALVRLYQLYLEEKNINMLGLNFVGAVIIALLIFLPAAKYSVAATENYISLWIGITVPSVLLLLSVLIPGRRNFLITTLIGGTLILVALYVLLPVTSYWGAVFGRGSSTIVSEMMPLTLTSAFANFGLLLILALPGLALWVWRRNSLILPIFTLPILISTINQIRFGYYLIIPTAIFAAYFLIWVTRKVRENVRVAVIVVVLTFVVMTSLVNIVTTATFKNTMSPSMYQALIWIRENTPPPSGNFYALKSRMPSYQVLGRWDYGSWIAYVARRAPLTSPRGWYLPKMTESFADGNIERLETIAEKLYGKGNVNIKYILLEKQDPKLGECHHTTKLQTHDIHGFETVYENDEVIILEKR
ncbi:hypothetical protein LCGC14_2061470 [marine sediment metagenome]|uniref:Glycosyltransferase RgtA/B/C/D-like domain-containing protein n=1 Tax=marine sediment metagenome TaxID=412755 RepID=A0A0F9EL92_9ZZZZ